MNFGKLGARGGFGSLGVLGKASNPGDPLAPPAPTLDLIAASDSGSSSIDNITNVNTPSLDITFGQLTVQNDVFKLYDNGVLLVSHTITALEAGSNTLSLGLSALADGVHSLAATHTIAGPHVSAMGASLAITVDTTAPTISTSGTQTVAENSAFSLQLAANETVTWTKTGGADTALFTLTGGGLLTMTAKNFESPSDADTNNSYIVQVTATDPAGNVTNKTVTVSVTNVNEAPTVANTIGNQSASVSGAFSFQFASNTFADVDAGDTLTYSATQTGGGALPAWLTFTAGTRTFSGTPAIGDVGTIHITVTATDSGSLTVTTAFDIVVANQTGREFVARGIFIDQTNVGNRQWQAGQFYNVET